MAVSVGAERPRVIANFVAGKLTAAAGASRVSVYNPATGAVSGEIPLATQEDVDRVVSVAKVAAESWSQVPLAKRTDILFNFREKVVANAGSIAAAITAEHGKTLDDATGEVARGIESIEYACGLIDHLKGEYSSQVATDVDVYSIKEPLGVVAGITPFNFPMMVPMWMAPLAIATGNTFILKPSPRDPSPSLMLAELWQEAGLPDGVFNVLQGDKLAVDGLLTHRDVDGISFVGSTPIAKYVHQTATAHGKRVQALGGAKNHAVVLPDADVDFASDHVSSAAFGSAGERCMAISVAVAVGGKAADALADRLRGHARRVVVADGTKPGAQMGPLISAQAKERVQRIIGEAVTDGARLVADGRGLVVAGHEKGFFVGPTVLDDVKVRMSAYKEEIFGPVLSIVRVPDLESAIRLINSNPYGNGTAIFTRSGGYAREFQRRVKVGTIGINVPIPIPLSWHSFGGWNDSLFGDYHIYGPEGVSFYTRSKVITQRWPRLSEGSGASFSFPTHQ